MMVENCEDVSDMHQLLEHLELLFVKRIQISREVRKHRKIICLWLLTIKSEDKTTCSHIACVSLVTKLNKLLKDN